MPYAKRSRSYGRARSRSSPFKKFTARRRTFKQSNKYSLQRMAANIQLLRSIKGAREQLSNVEAEMKKDK